MNIDINDVSERDKKLRRNCDITLALIVCLMFVAICVISTTDILWSSYSQAFAWVYILAIGQFRRRWRLLILLGMAPVVGVGLHFLQNCWAIGFSVAMADNLGFSSRDGSIIRTRTRFFILQQGVRAKRKKFMSQGWADEAP